MNEILNPSAITDNKGMTSIEIAEVTGKEHKNVMRDIRSILSQGVSQLNFELSSYKQPQPKGGYKDVPCYNLTPKGCLILASGYDAALREKIIDRLEDLEKKKDSYPVPQTFAQALMLAAKQQQAIEEQQRQIEQKDTEIKAKNTEIIQLSTAITEMQPKVSYVDTILQCKDTVQTTIIAQDYGMSAKAFNILLRNLKIQRKVGTTWVIYGNYLAKGYVQSETFTYRHRDGSQGAGVYTKWTQKGRLFLYQILKKHNILPLIEQTGNN